MNVWERQRIRSGYYTARRNRSRCVYGKQDDVLSCSRHGVIEDIETHEAKQEKEAENEHS